MYDFPNEYEAQAGNRNHMDSKAVLGSATDKQEWVKRNSWGMLVAMTSPGQESVAQRLEEFGFQKLMTTSNPVYSNASHKIILWGLDITKYTQADLETSEQKKAKKLEAAKSKE